MSQLTQLRQVLHIRFDWHGARLMFLSQFLLTLLRVGSVNLSELATAFVGSAQSASHYKRLQRFLREYRLSISRLCPQHRRLAEAGEGAGC